MLGQRIVKIYNGQAFERDYFARVNEDNRWLSMKVVATRAGSSALIQFIARHSGTMKVRPDQKILVTRDWPTPDDRLQGAKALLGQLVKLAA